MGERASKTRKKAVKTAKKPHTAKILQWPKKPEPAFTGEIPEDFWLDWMAASFLLPGYSKGYEYEWDDDSTEA